MAPDVRGIKALRAMRELGIKDNVSKPVLKSLYIAYDKNWDFIEEDNYRLLIDTILEKDEGQAAQPRKKKLDANAQLAEVRTRRHNEEVQVAVTKKRNGSNQEVADGEAEVHREPEPPLKRLRKTYQENPIASSSLAFLKPKDEPTDDLLPPEASVAAINPDHRRNGVPDSTRERRTNSKFANIVDESSPKVELASVASGEVKIFMSCTTLGGGANFSCDELFKRTEDECLQSYKFLDPSFSVRKILDKLCQCALELGTSSKESQRVIHVTPADDSFSKSTHLDADAVENAPVTPQRSSHSQEAQLEEAGILCLPPAPNGIGHSAHSENGFTAKENEQNGVESTNSQTMMVAEPLELMPLETSAPMNFVADISKAVETVQIPLVNEVNNELLPAFHYIRGNIKFEKADVSFSLARIGDSYCSTCSEDCVSSLCACAHATGGVVYNVEGLLKEGFLEDCISVDHEFLKDSRSYCMDCPLERSKEEDTREGCKGHLMRKFIKECGLKCDCNGLCGNRVVQRDIKTKLQVFMTATGKGWGLRTLEELPKGAFVCEFAGEILTTNELYRRVSESSSMEKHEIPVLLDADWKGRLVKDEQALCLDAAYYGNVARFINHCCFNANLIGIPVEVDTPEHHYYHFALFTTRKVDAFEELTRDYGIDFDDDGNEFKKFECLCGSNYCRNLKRMTRSRSTKRRG